MDRSALPVTFMVPRLSPSEPCSAEFTVVGRLPGFCAELCVAALLEAKFEAGGAELRDAAAARELCDDEILEAELAVAD